MNYKLRTKHGLSLMEEAVVLAVIALLVVLGVPAVRALFRSVESGSGARAMISAALASGRAIAAKEQHYAGIRFQNKYQQDNKGCQYMIFIVQDPKIMAYGFRAVEGLQPIKLPDSIGVMDLMIVPTRNTLIPVNPSEQFEIDRDDRINDSFELLDTTTFSIIFSPTGKLVVHGVRVRNRDGKTATSSSPYSDDDIFNRISQVEAGIGMFLQDDYYPGYTGTPTPNFGLGPEPSRNSFIIYERDKFEETYKKGRAWSDYLVTLIPEVIYINPYTGTMINK